MVFDIERTVDGYFVTAGASPDVIRATIHQLEKSRGWRVCFATCFGKHSDLTGKASDHKTLSDCTDQIKELT